MRAIPERDERQVHELEAARSWKRSGLLSAEQLAAIENDVGEPPLAAGYAIRLLLFGLCLVAQAALLWFVFGSRIDRHGAGVLAFGAAFYVLGEFALRTKRLYRFGFEEALFVGAVLFVLLGLAFGDEHRRWFDTERLAIPALLMTTALYLRLGYLYAGLAALGCVAWAVTTFFKDELAVRALSAGAYALLLAASFARRPSEPEAGRWRFLQAACFLGAYLFIHLRLEGLLEPTSHRSYGSIEDGGVLYWATFAAIWVLPPAALASGIRLRHRPLLAAGVVSALLTLCSVKPYFWIERNPWDPALLGLLLLGVSIALNRWLRAGREGFTSKKLLESRDEGFSGMDLAGVAAVAAAASVASPASAQPTEKGFQGGGGSSGGGGASGGF